ncbi:hypothetical protein [Mobilicoccus pelagius]|uniref:Secreted protein n=1 Tax=Mobilicoccus pelagius NBRC 104925 TaxID=1089455 RepID=H5UPR5_9MICO|nr:hypothetical protein [Mobilicoccus pelagius]GAB47889.1 hypothetical protein MOPEL_029_01720 [Mobilicoccus pelagius NBRC 104925]
MKISRMAVAVACATTLLGGVGGGVAMAADGDPSPAAPTDLPSPTTNAPNALFGECGRVGVLCIQDLGNGRLGRISQDNADWGNLAGWDWRNQAD